MGSCVSLHHKQHESAMKLRLTVDHNNDTLLIPSPVKPSSDAVNGALNDVSSFKTSNLSRGFPGSKEEAFFDSQPWMDSDCDDDFYSVNGDFTPSRGNTPVHHNFAPGKLQVIKPTLTEEAATDAAPSPPEKKKRLSELFKESLRHGVEEEKASENGTVSPPAKGEVNINGKITNGASKESKSYKSVQCCIPVMRSSRSFNERKKKTSTSPVHSVG